MAYKYIELTQGKKAKVDADDFEYLNQWKWQATEKKYTFYAVRNYIKKDGKRSVLRMHRYLLNAPFGMEVDQEARRKRNS